MNIEKMLQNLTPEKLEAGLSKLNGVLSPDEINQIRQVLSNPNKTELSQKLKDVDVDKVKGNPNFKGFFSG